MRGRLALLAAMLLSPGALAQRLNLDGPTHAGPGECATFLTLAADTESRAGDGPDPASAARRAIAKLAAEVLRRSEQGSPVAARNLLLSMTLVQRLPAIDAAIARTDPAMLTVIAKDAAALAANPPTDADALSIAVRDILAPLTDGSETPSAQSPWNCARAERIPDEDVLPLLRAATGGIGESMAIVDRRFAVAETMPAYAAVVLAGRARIAAAGRLALKPPGWLPAPAKSAALRHLADAIKRSADEPQSAETLRRLERLALVGRIAVGVDSQRGASATRAQQALARLATAGPADEPTLRNAERRKLAAIAAAAELLPLRERSRDERVIIRQFRPGLRTMLELAKLTEADLLEVIPDTMDAPGADAINDPKFIAAVAAHKRRLDDLAAIVEASNAILIAQGAPPVPNADPAAREEYKLLGDRLLAFAKDAFDLAQRNDPLLRDQLEQALARVRGLAVDARDFAELPGERDLRAAAAGGAASASASLLAETAAPLLALLEADRAAWLKGWGSPDKAPVDTGTRLRRLHDLMLAVGDAAEVERLRTSGLSPAWPGWEMTPTTLGTLAADLSTAARDAAKAHLDKSPDAAAQARNLVNQFAPALLAGRFARTLPGCRGPIAELTAGPPDVDTPMFDRLADLAMICRESHELAARLLRKEEVSRLRASVTVLAAACWHDAPRPARSTP